MDKFYSKFIKLLKEQPELDPEAEAAAAQETLGDDVTLDDYGTDMEVDPNAIQDEVTSAIENQNSQMKTSIASWLPEIERFNEYITNTIQPMVKNAPPETVLADLDGRAKSMIGKVANDLAYIKQALDIASK